MNLDILDNLINNLKENDFIKKFGEELNNYLDDKIESQNGKIDINQESILEEIQNENKITTECRDKMLIARSSLLQEYAKDTSDKGTMYYIYDYSEDIFLLTICEKEKSNKVIKIPKEELPKEAKIDCILRIKNGKYELDKEATEIIKNKMSEEFNRLIEEQTKIMEERRIEGHIYEFVERTSDRIFLIDNTKNDGNVFEEFKFLEETFKDANEGDLFEYTNGKYSKLR